MSRVKEQLAPQDYKGADMLVSSASKLSGVRVMPWINTETFVPQFGLQVRTAPRKWRHVVNKDGFCLFDNKQEAEEAATELRAKIAAKAAA